MYFIKPVTYNYQKAGEEKRKDFTTPFGIQARGFMDFEAAVEVLNYRMISSIKIPDVLQFRDLLKVFWWSS